MLVATEPGEHTLGRFRWSTTASATRRRRSGSTWPAQRPPGAASALGRRAHRRRRALFVSPAKTEAFVGERVPLSSNSTLATCAWTSCSFRRSREGYSVDSFPQPAQRDEIQAGRRYRVVAFETSLTPLKPGSLSLGPGTMQMNLLVSRRRSNPMDDFFGDAFAESVRSRPGRSR